MNLVRGTTLSVIGLAIASAILIKSTQRFETSIKFEGEALKSLTCNDTEYLENGEMRVEHVTLQKPSGETYAGDTSGRTELDVAHQQIKKTLAWGIVRVAYAAFQNQVKLTVRVTNTSPSDTIQGLWLEPLTLKFPQKVQDYDGTTPLLAHSVGEVAIVRASYGSGAVAVASEDLEKPLMVGFPWANDRPHNTIFPLSVHTGRVDSYPDSYPMIDRPIAPNSMDQFSVSIRFGSADSSRAELAEDIYKRFGEVYPSKLNWPDRRPIGAIFLATAGQNFANNPQGWFGDPHTDVTTVSGRAAFRQRVLATADAAIAIMKGMNAQGAITWDIEGQRYPHAISFVGDPRQFEALAPEMANVADEYFQRFRNAGLRVGVCVRPQQFAVSVDGQVPAQMPVADPAQLLIDKIAYARKRWGIGLVYLDSNANAQNSNPMDASVLQKVVTAFPDVLIVAEHYDLRYYAYAAPYKELRRGEMSTPDDVHAAYKNAFSLVYTADGPLDLYRKSLVKAVKQGDSMMYRTWYADPQNEKVKALYLQ